MPEFVLNRKFTLSGPGHMINFEKGQPTYVPPEMVKAAIGIGAELLDGDKDAAFSDDEVQEKPPLTPQEKEELFFTAFQIIIDRAGREDFDGAGKPHMDALKKELDFSFSKKERDAAWQKFREAKAEE